MTSKNIVLKAIKEYETVENTLKELQGHNFDYVCRKITEKFYGNTHNYDGELFDFCLSRILGTIKKGKGRTAILDKYFMFDISENLSGEWLDTSIDELRKAVN